MSLTHEENACPEDVLMAIAWYPDGLDAAQRGLVEAHAADCAACREELAFVRGENAAAPSPREESDRVYARVIERIEAYEAKQRPTAVMPLRSAVSGSWGVGRVAAALLVAACVGGFVGSRWLAPEASVYHTASESADVAASASAATLALDVVFRPDATAERIQAALRAIGGEIESGPTQLGVYRVRLTPTADASAAATALRGEGQGVATFAEIAPR